ncbi:hypothetical protein [Halosegnis sp.]|uniref:hypothetical protein n=1 Tax=Halosegnis sp. TaxID=2864959 RepID=UPI0035D412EA
MNFLAAGPVRAGAFFAAGLTTATLAGIVVGEPRAGFAAGVAAGLVLGGFGWMFVRPAEDP